MTALIVLCAVLLIISVLVFAPLYVGASYQDGDICAHVKIAFFKFTVYDSRKPSKPKKPKKSKKAKKQKPTKKAKSASKESSKEKKKFSFEDFIANFDLYKKTLLDVLKAVGNAIAIYRIKLHVEYGAKDPAATGIMYGQICCVIGLLHEAMQKYVKKQADINIIPVFTGEYSRIVAYVELKTGIAKLLMITVPVLRVVVQQKTKHKQSKA